MTGFVALCLDKKRVRCSQHFAKEADTFPNLPLRQARVSQQEAGPRGVPQEAVRDSIDADSAPRRGRYNRLLGNVLARPQHDLRTRILAGHLNAIA